MYKIIAFLLLSASTYAQEIKGTYAIKNAETGVYMRVKDANGANGTPIVTYSPVNWKCVTWDFKQKENNVYVLENLFTHKTMQPAKAAGKGVAMEEQPLDPAGKSQQYEFIPNGKDNYLIRLAGTELYLTPSVNSDESNAPIILLPANGSRLQSWTLKEQHPTM